MQMLGLGMWGGGGGVGLCVCGGVWIDGAHACSGSLVPAGREESSRCLPHFSKETPAHGPHLPSHSSPSQTARGEGAGSFVSAFIPQLVRRELPAPAQMRISKGAGQLSPPHTHTPSLSLPWEAGSLAGPSYPQGFILALWNHAEPAMWLSLIGLGGGLP